MDSEYRISDCLKNIIKAGEMLKETERYLEKAAGGGICDKNNAEVNSKSQTSDGSEDKDTEESTVSTAGTESEANTVCITEQL